MRPALVVAVTLLGLVSLASPLAAQDPPSPEPPANGDARDAEARAMYQAGAIAYADGRFADALASWRRAHELSRRPELLFNIGTAAERLRRDAEALGAFEGYLAGRPDASNARQVRARIAVLREAIRSASAPREPPPDD